MCFSLVVDVANTTVNEATTTDDYTHDVNALSSSNTDDYTHDVNVLSSSNTDDYTHDVNVLSSSTTDAYTHDVNALSSSTTDDYTHDVDALSLSTTNDLTYDVNALISSTTDDYTHDVNALSSSATDHLLTDTTVVRNGPAISTPVRPTVLNENNDLISNIGILEIMPIYGPVAGGTKISVTLKCPQSGCGDVTLDIEDNQCVKLQQIMYVNYNSKNKS